jgi:hypothetical protein
VVHAPDGVNVAAFSGKEPSGPVVIAGSQVSVTASGSVVTTANGSSGVIVSEQSAVICAPSVLAVGAQSAAQASGNNIMLGIPVEVGSMYSEMSSICKSMAQLYLDSVDWLTPVPPTVVSSVDFRFRTSEQYGTKQDSGVSGGSFRMYEPAWAVMAEAKRVPLKGIGTRGWDEGEDAGGGSPWPGTDAIQANSYRVYKERNVSNSGVEDAGEGEAHLTEKPFSQYHIRKS